MEWIGVFTGIVPVRCEGSLTCVYATASDAATQRDLLTLPWGKVGQRRRWPDWRVDRARPTAAQRQAEDHAVVTLTAIPGRGNRRRLEWRDVARALKLKRHRCYVQVRGGARAAATIAIHVPPAHAESVRRVLERTTSIANGNDTWHLVH